MTRVAAGRPRCWWTLGVPVFLVLLPVLDAGGQTMRPREGRGGPTWVRTPQPRPSGIAHTVRAGDTLWNVSRRYGVDLGELVRANGLAVGQPIRIGQRLTIPSAAFGRDRQEPPSMAEIVLGAPPEAHRLALLWPVAATVGSPFGPRGASWHGGIDLVTEPGAPIRAAAPGVVIASGSEGGYGNVVKIWHTPELMTVYAHNAENHVRPGEWVDRGQVIGTVGRTGRATAPHLHFEVRLDGKKYDPLYWLPDQGATDLARLGPGGPPAGR